MRISFLRVPLCLPLLFAITLWTCQLQTCQFAGAQETLAVDTARSVAKVVSEEFIFEEAAFPQCHASTVVQTQNGLVAAWFGGKREKDPSVGIWVSRLSDGNQASGIGGISSPKPAWTDPVEVANGDQTSGDIKRYPCWNPVLFQQKEGPLLLFYKVGPDPVDWWGEFKTSNDEGKTWSPASRLPDGFFGPIKNKPVAIGKDAILCGASTEGPAGWKVHMELRIANGKQWWRTPAIDSAQDLQIIQPAFIWHKNQIVALCRSKHQQIVSIKSDDRGQTWQEPQLTNLPNPNSGFDAVSTSDGKHYLVYNHTRKGRSPLNLSVSNDLEHWQPLLTLEDQPGEYSYPAIIQTADGLLHITYTWKRRRIKHVVVDPRQ